MIYTSEDESIQYAAKDIFNLLQGLGYKVQRPLSTSRSILISIWSAGAPLSLLFFSPAQRHSSKSNFIYQVGSGDLDAQTRAWPSPAQGSLTLAQGAAGGSEDTGPSQAGKQALNKVGVSPRGQQALEGLQGRRAYVGAGTVVRALIYL